MAEPIRALFLGGGVDGEWLITNGSHYWHVASSTDLHFRADIRVDDIIPTTYVRRDTYRRVDMTSPSTGNVRVVYVLENPEISTAAEYYDDAMRYLLAGYYSPS